MQKFDTFLLKNGREVDIVFPSMEYLKAVTDFVNKLSKEDTYLSFAGEEYSLEHERAWLENILNEIKFKKNYIIWAVVDGRIIGGCDIKVGRKREEHVGTIGLMVDSNFRGQGLGEYLIRKILKIAKEAGLQIAKLDVFSDNVPAVSLYKKVGFVEYGRLPDGFFRKEKFSDKVEMYKNLK
ncbi:TPA: GNAT family N-acetyltransferase [Candidatus Berkelbacteria bacterium]|uniref:Acetyltransferase n=1 Tax=Berkelbacteria bacterium GW2011_GWE1_39_12 TaxID=1618337 RepID=A0A0G4B4F4_9BACT|nr:MAG: acetyltransferase [Berkelbacteria bacterium GW2011_GWE1_39_12]HBO60414.1 GNAT family N-acetyltransferase [Candidatus Berkelbacteria bacterium]